MAFIFPDWIDLAGIGFLLLLIILAALLWMWWSNGDSH